MQKGQRKQVKTCTGREKDKQKTMIKLETVGFEALTQSTKDGFLKIFEEQSEKIERKLKGIDSCKVMLKEYTHGGKTKFSMRVTANYAGKTLEAEASDWDLRRTVHKVFNKISEEAEHLFHISDQNKKNKRRI